MNAKGMQALNAGIVVLFLALLQGLTGCASPMALSPRGDKPDLTDESIAVFTLRTRNEFKPRYLPRARTIDIVNKNTKEVRRYRLPRFHERDGDSLEYLVSVQVQPGSYHVGTVSGNSPRFPLEGFFRFPVNADFKVPEKSVTYVGHVSMVNRKRDGDEPRSGPVVGFPIDLTLIGQAVSGYSGGTFDIDITNRSETDIPLFKETYLGLRDIPVEINLMQPE